MRRFAILLLLPLVAVASLAAADQPQPLDPHKPADAIVIVDQLTRQLALPREQAVGLTIAIETLAKAVAPAPAAPAPAPAPVTPAKKD